MKRLIAFAALGFSCAAQQKFIYPTPSAGQFTVQKDLAYRKIADRELKFDLYRPASGTPRLPVLIFMDAFGGDSQRGWEIYTGWAKAATAHGFAAVNADTHTDGAAGDFDALAEYFRQHSAELKIDPDRIAVYAASGNAYRGLPILKIPSAHGSRPRRSTTEAPTSRGIVPRYRCSGCVRDSTAPV